MGYLLQIPEEPVTLLSELRESIMESPAEALRRIDDGEWIVDTLWPVWREQLQQAGVDRAQFGRIIVGYQTEIRLWAMGERTWMHCVEGLIGRVERRTEISTT